MKKTLLLALFALPIAVRAAEDITWSCGFTNETEIATYVQAKSIGNAILSSGSAASGITCSIDTGSGQSPKANEKYLKIVPGTTAGGYYATIALPEWKPCENWSFSFDYAPSRGGNNNNNCDYGIAVHDTYGRALFSCKGHQESYVSSFTVYKGCDGEQSLFSTNSVGDFSESYDSNTTNRWMRFVLTGSSTGTTLSIITNLANNAALDLSSSSLGSSFAVPAKILVRTGNQASRLQWACVDDISFTGTAKAFNKIADYDFEEDDDQSILTNGFVTSTLLGTTAITNDTVNWTVAEGSTGAKLNEKFARLAAAGDTSTHGMLVSFPFDIVKEQDKATTYELSFDAVVEADSNTGGVNGMVVVGSNGTHLATLKSTTSTATLYNSSGTAIADSIQVSSRGTTSDPATNDIKWHRFIFKRDDAGAMKLTMVSLATGETIIEDVTIENEAISQIAFVAKTSNKDRYGYAAIDNIKVWTYRKGGFTIIIADGDEEADKVVESDALKTWCRG